MNAVGHWRCFHPCGDPDYNGRICPPSQCRCCKTSCVILVALRPICLVWLPYLDCSGDGRSPRVVWRPIQDDSSVVNRCTVIAGADRRSSCLPRSLARLQATEVTATSLGRPSAGDSTVSSTQDLGDYRLGISVLSRSVGCHTGLADLQAGTSAVTADRGRARTVGNGAKTNPPPAGGLFSIRCADATLASFSLLSLSWSS